MGFKIHTTIRTPCVNSWGHSVGGGQIRDPHSIMDTYNDTKNAEYKTPQNKTSKVAFLFFLRELKEMINIIKMIINDHLHHHHRHPPFITSSSSIIRSIIIITINHTTTQKKISSTIQSINHHQKKKFSTKNSSNHQGYTDQKKLMKTSKFIKNMKIIKTMKTPQNEGTPYPPM